MAAVTPFAATTLVGLTDAGRPVFLLPTGVSIDSRGRLVNPYKSTLLIDAHLVTAVRVPQTFAQTLALGVQAGITPKANWLFAGKVTLGVQAGWAFIAHLKESPKVTLAVASGVSDVTHLTMHPVATLGAQPGIAESGLGKWPKQVTEAIQAALTAIVHAAMKGTLSLPMAAAFTAIAHNLLKATIALQTAAGFQALGHKPTANVFLLKTAAGFSPIAHMATKGTLALPIAAGLTPHGYIPTAQTLNLRMQAGIAPAGHLTTRQLLTLATAGGVAETGVRPLTMHLALAEADTFSTTLRPILPGVLALPTAPAIHLLGHLTQPSVAGLVAYPGFTARSLLPGQDAIRLTVAAGLMVSAVVTTRPTLALSVAGGAMDVGREQMPALIDALAAAKFLVGETQKTLAQLGLPATAAFATATGAVKAVLATEAMAAGVLPAAAVRYAESIVLAAYPALQTQAPAIGAERVGLSVAANLQPVALIARRDALSLDMQAAIAMALKPILPVKVVLGAQTAMAEAGTLPVPTMSTVLGSVSGFKPVGSVTGAVYSFTLPTKATVTMIGERVLAKALTLGVYPGLTVREVLVEPNQARLTAAAGFAVKSVMTTKNVCNWALIARTFDYNQSHMPNNILVVEKAATILISVIHTALESVGFPAAAAMTLALHLAKAAITQEIVAAGMTPKAAVQMAQRIVLGVYPRVRMDAEGAAQSNLEAQAGVTVRGHVQRTSDAIEAIAAGLHPKTWLWIYEYVGRLTFAEAAAGFDLKTGWFLYLGDQVVSPKAGITVKAFEAMHAAIVEKAAAGFRALVGPLNLGFLLNVGADFDAYTWLWMYEYLGRATFAEVAAGFEVKAVVKPFFVPKPGIERMTIVEAGGRPTEVFVEAMTPAAVVTVVEPAASTNGQRRVTIPEVVAPATKPQVTRKVSIADLPQRAVSVEPRKKVVIPESVQPPSDVSDVRRRRTIIEVIRKSDKTEGPS